MHKDTNNNINNKVKMRPIINKVENNKTIKKISETKTWFFEKIHKIDKPLAMTTKDKRIHKLLISKMNKGSSSQIKRRLDWI